MKVDALAFWTKKPADGPRGWNVYWDTLHAPHRDGLVRTLAALPPFTSLLEVGCGPGVNLWRIQEAFPDADLTGLDVSQAAVNAGAERFAAAETEGRLKGSGRVALCAGVLPEALDAMSPVDVVLTCYALAYIWPNRIGETLTHLLALAEQALVIAEPMVMPGFPSGPIYRHPAEFRYDYLQWFSASAPGWQVTSLKPLSVDRMNRVLVAQKKG
jgi:SAM-dependent methyltransferase